ncbi:hypothetical protein [Streptacidiphilus cavernicola]|uniref:Uncharacterized protein n=1 Tax=Streptacidiphilus cavernicola TaxID=3342716 RepID=A0ABV6VPA2_9ACTN
MSQNDLAALAGRIAALERLVTQLNRTSRLGQSSIEGGAIQVYDTGGTHRASLGVQEDGTVGLTAVNGPIPPAPMPPQLASVLGGVAAAWDGGFAGAATAPLDWTFTEVHASTTTADFTPGASTLCGTIATVFGGTLVVPADAPVWVRLLARTTSGVASDPSGPSGPVGPAPVVAQEVLDGIVSDLALADGAVTAAKIAAGAVDAQALADGAVTADAIGQAAVTAGALASAAVTPGALASGAVTPGALASGAVTPAALAAGAVTAASLAAGSVTAASIAAGAVTAAAITAGAVTAGKIAAGAVTASTIAAGAVTAGSIAASSITGTQLAAATIQASNLAANSVAAGTIAAAAITGREIAALAVTSDKLAANSVTASSIAAGTIDATKLLISAAVSNLLPDPGFETATGAAQVTAGGSAWSLDTTTFSSGTRSVRFSATAATATTSDLPVLKGVPVTPGDQLYIAADWRATVLTGSAPAQKLYLRWKDGSGATLSYSVLQAPATLDATWRTISTIATAPAGAVTVDATLQAFSYTAATLWWDNLVVRPVVGATQIQSGAIQTTHLSATAIDGKVITGATLRTGASGQRIEIVPQGALGYLNGDQKMIYPAGVVWYTGLAGEVSPGEIMLFNSGSEFGVQPTLQLSTADMGHGSGTLQLIAGNAGGDNAGLLVDVADQTLMVSKLNGILAGDSNSLYLRADGESTIYFGAVSVGLVQDWTTVTMASGYAHNGNSNGNVQYRVIDFLGTRFVQWRGGFAATYSSGVPINSGTLLSAAVPSLARPSARRSMTCACSVSSSVVTSMKVDFGTDGTATLVSAGTTNNPPWVSLNGVMYSL